MSSVFAPQSLHESPSTAASWTEPYLHKIQVDPRKPDLLTRMHFGHVSQIPFEMIDAFCGLSPVFDLDVVCKRLIFDQRGGGCTQMNGLFASVAEYLGFSVRRCLARVMGSWSTGAATHMVLVVQEGDIPYLCDVGYGLNGPRFPIPLISGAVSPQGHVVFRARQIEAGVWEIDRQEPSGTWNVIYSFATQSFPYIDFMAPHYFNGTSEKSIYTSNFVCARLIEGGGFLLHEKVLHERTLTTAKRTKISNCVDLKKVLTETFGIFLDQATLDRLGRRLDLELDPEISAPEVLAT
ncbi:N-hydroxyarylamine O-acetyltransferase [Shimia isoporae]|uniref:N-hydroxyarylamine O-acetyltransferase n=1 Tax=Shimia isoporae TaxID=647720 RepID=A0A4V2Q3R8_9RHOB|nr:arylamine N-acetyltransferase [Shimia isoporae]TCL08300.1 N-hydroxyarylamine O-acetyltransferase [Shimia isoporae]